MADVKWPFGPADSQTLTAAATVTPTISDTKTLVSFSGAAGADMTMNLTIGSNVEKGAELHVKLLSDGTARSFTPGTKMIGAAVAGVISKTKMISFVYDGSNFVNTAAIQID